MIVPDAEAIETIVGGDHYSWYDAIAFAEAYSDGANTDYRLITKSEAFEILTNNDLLAILALTGTTENFWTIEENEVENAYYFDGIQGNVSSDDKTVTSIALPVRKVNFYGLPLIESEFGGGLVYDVVAATRTVHVVANCNIFSIDAYTWENAMSTVPTEIGSEMFDSLPTRAQMLKILGNSYLVTLAGLPGLPVDKGFWTNEEDQEADAWAYWNTTNTIESTGKTETLYALPVRSEVVPET